MKIQRIHVRKEDLLLTRPYTIAFKTVDAVENGIIEIIADNGLKGYGAFNPSHFVVGEYLDDALATLNEGNLSVLIGRELDDIDALCAIVQHTFKASPTARTGLEIALYDLFTQGLGLPLAGFLGQRITSMPTSITIGIKGVAGTLEEAREYTDRGFKILKVKLGISLQEDLERLIRLRETFGYGIGIIIDANQGYNGTQLSAFTAQTRRLQIGLIEQPLPVGQEDTMRRLPDDIKKLVAADESLVTPEHATKLAAAPAACGFFNIKLMKCGGISQALRIADTAARHSIDLMWGCNDESIISITAALHTAFSCPHTKFIDLDGSLDMARDVVAGGFLLKDGIMSISGKPGLGLTAL
ncbi:dipeptide epimerase [Flavitalea sp. BT771]|uniref:mandelate racemase/muconate lactonizing enzyme family protein n=1 Tax=Flavitalea sp. BT771 TaxID=3063329 RepID=UPI0026E206FF|nr:dipeptide epimerase [Flavitalea sp. BT771]MDO6435217.1 dipeptide epimerase [Flavitalea sp. BT771]MDV6224078.1 dipeptide epimerase [Flavitalea sp. BT771]